MSAKILLVEDEAITAMDLQRKLEFWGYTVVGTAHDGPSAIELAREHEPDLILMDIVLKGDIDGVEVAERIRDLEVPVVFISAHSEETTMRRAGNTSPYGYLIKPFDEKELVFTIEMAIHRHRSDRQVKKLNRALRMLSDCNQAIVRIKDADELLNEICRIIVEVGGYRMAWIGLAEHEEEKSVHPIAEYGFHEGYLDSIRVSWGDDEYGAGPVGGSIRRSEPVIIRNTEDDPRFNPWRDKAVEMGFLSVIGLPLTVSGETIASLAVYSRERDAFDEEEVELLMELAGDISFYLESKKEMERLENIREYSPVGILTLKMDEEPVIMDINMEARRMLLDEEPVGKKLRDVTHFMKKEVSEICNLEDGTVHDMDCVEYSDGKSTRFLSIRAVRSGDTVSVFLNDITECIMTRKRLEECEGRLN